MHRTWALNPVCRATALVSLSVCSGPLQPGSVTRSAGTARSPAGAHSPEVPGDHPVTSTLSATGPCSRTPPRSWRSPRPGGETWERRRDHSRAGQADLPGRSSTRCRAAPGGSAGETTRIAARPPVGEPAMSPRPPPGAACAPRGTRTCCCRASSVRAASSPRRTARSLGALPMSPARVHSRGVSSPSASRCHPTRPVPPAWFDSHLGGFLRAPVPRLSHLVPA